MTELEKELSKRYDQLLNVTEKYVYLREEMRFMYGLTDDKNIRFRIANALAYVEEL